MRRLAAVKKNPVMADGAYSLKALDGQDILTGAWEESCGREGGTLEEARENRKIRLAGIFSLKGRAAEVETDLSGRHIPQLRGQHGSAGEGREADLPGGTDDSGMLICR